MTLPGPSRSPAASPPASRLRGSAWMFVRGMAPFFRPYVRQIGLWFGVYGAFFLAGILTPLAVTLYFDRVLPAASVPRIWLFAGAYLVYALLLNVLSFFGQVGTNRVIESVVADLRSAVYEKLHHLSIRYFDRTLSGEIVNRVTTDTRQILNLLGGELVNVSLQVVMGAVSLVILVAWNAKLAAVVLAFLPVYVMIVRRFRPLVHKAAGYWRRSEDRMWGNWGEKLRGIDIIQSFTREKSEELKQHRFGHAAADRYYRMQLYGTAMGVLGGLTSGICNYASYSIGCLLVVDGELSLGALLSLSGLISYILAPVQRGFGMVATWQQSAVSARRVLDILEEMEEASPPRGTRPIGRLRGEVRYGGVHFEYERGKPVLENINLDISAGQRVALVGHTGCGKTTMVNLLLGFYRPRLGTILLDGMPTTGMDPRDIRRNMGVVPQAAVLFHDTLRANIVYGARHASEEETARAVRMAQLGEFVAGLPRGLDTMIGGEGGVNPSEGECQRISIARALVKDPAVVVFDEATSSLDSTEEATLQRAVRDMLSGRTSIIIAHRLSTIRDCDLVVVMEAGHIVEAGPPAELLVRRDGVFARLQRDQVAGGGGHG